ncbi:hypothetical protein ACOJCM_10060 [Billgrantia sp. LNSP4103-1]|uniref:hypothetical protein n=1 Tax=Billgrantia sp. LNSP4103-1 TaxID=3410266 RepID=UPI00403F666A
MGKLSRLRDLFKSQRSLNHELDVAIFWKYKERVEELLNHGANPNGANIRQYYLGKAVEGGDIEIVKLLLEAGADPRMPFRWWGGEQVTMSEGAARLKRSDEFVKLLKDAEDEAVRTLGPGPKLFKPSNSCMFSPRN